MQRFGHTHIITFGFGIKRKKKKLFNLSSALSVNLFHTLGIDLAFVNLPVLLLSSKFVMQEKREAIDNEFVGF